MDRVHHSGCAAMAADWPYRIELNSVISVCQQSLCLGLRQPAPFARHPSARRLSRAFSTASKADTKFRIAPLACSIFSCCVAAGSVSSACTRSESVITTAWRASLRGLSLANVVIASAAMYLACRSTLIVSLLFGLVDRAAVAACVAFSSSLMPTICAGAEHSYVHRVKCWASSEFSQQPLCFLLRQPTPNHLLRHSPLGVSRAVPADSVSESRAIAS
jgi:hypothetical protein